MAIAGLLPQDDASPALSDYWTNQTISSWGSRSPEIIGQRSSTYRGDSSFHQIQGAGIGFLKPDSVSLMYYLGYPG
jgi:hypothetical protein